MEGLLSLGKLYRSEFCLQKVLLPLKLNKFCRVPENKIQSIFGGLFQMLS